MFFCSLIFQYCKWSIHHSNYNVKYPKQLSLSRPNRNETFGHAFFTWLVQHISPFIAVHLSVKKTLRYPSPFWKRLVPLSALLSFILRQGNCLLNILSQIGESPSYICNNSCLWFSGLNFVFMYPKYKPTKVKSLIKKTQNKKIASLATSIIFFFQIALYECWRIEASLQIYFISKTYSIVFTKNIAK